MCKAKKYSSFGATLDETSASWSCRMLRHQQLTWLPYITPNEIGWIRHQARRLFSLLSSVHSWHFLLTAFDKFFTSVSSKGKGGWDQCPGVLNTGAKGYVFIFKVLLNLWHPRSRILIYIRLFIQKVEHRFIQIAYICWCGIAYLRLPTCKTGII